MPRQQSNPANIIHILVEDGGKACSVKGLAEGTGLATIPEGQSKGQITLKAAGDAKPIANWPLAVMANVSVNFVMKVWYAAPLSLTVKK